MATNYPLFHETLSAAVEAAHVYFAAIGAVLASDTIREAFMFGGIPYGQTKEGHGEISTLRGKSTKKFAHVTIYRMDSGRYELTCYVL